VAPISVVSYHDTSSVIISSRGNKTLWPPRRKTKFGSEHWGGRNVNVVLIVEKKLGESGVGLYLNMHTKDEFGLYMVEGWSWRSVGWVW
jgi:hypothetical protein